MSQYISQKVAEDKNLCGRCDHCPTSGCFNGATHSKKCWYGNYYVVIECTDFLPIQTEFNEVRMAV